MAGSAEKKMRPEILWLLLGMAAVTFLPRFIPMALLTRWAIPEKMKIVLDYMPVAILSAIVFPILFSSNKGNVGVEPRLLLAAFPVFIFAHKMRNLWGSVVLGMLIYWGLGFVL
jgi:branched-subunit amino acid transport protein